MPTEEETYRAREALHHVTQASRQLEEVRNLLVLRAEVALAAGATPTDVAAAAGVRLVTLRTWLTRRQSS
ncbi:hypothetical protein ACI3ET_01260 [Ornithinimicrobium sp. LYQ121]|uniref:hypothetical protein n=1 Tax=Ornithinimicrobium sp. LYQ121 TaxID=3378801 RepID=UPI003851DE1A